MKICIYCKRGFSEKSQEHVIPRWFGTFWCDTWTLDSVCKDCNNTFGRTLDIHLLKDSLEGSARYNIGKKRSSEHFSNKHTFFILPEDFEIELFRWCKVLLNHKEWLIELPPPTQIWFFHNQTKSYKYFFENELEALNLQEEWLTSEGIKLIWTDWDDTFEILKAKAIQLFKYKEGESIYLPMHIPETSNGITVQIEWVITHTHRRAITRIGYNYLAYVFWPEFLLHDEFNNLRRFIFNESTEGISIIATNQPLLFDESENKRRMGNYFLITAENITNGILLQIQFYHLFTYEIRIKSHIKIPKDIGYKFEVDKKPEELLSWYR